MQLLTPGNKRRFRTAGASVRKQAPQRKLNKAVVLKWITLLVLFSGLGLGLVSTPRVFEKVSNQQVEHVVIQGDINFISEEEVLSAVNVYIIESMVMVDLVDIKKTLEDMPWVSEVTIRKEWPDTLVLNMVEEKAIARWGERHLLNQDGVIFEPSNIIGLEQLAILSGPIGTERQVMEQYLLFNQLLFPRGLRMSELMLDNRHAWTVMLGNGVEINVGKSKVMERMKRLVEFVDPVFIEQMASVDAIDLRYANGIAVRNKLHNAEEVVSL